MIKIISSKIAARDTIKAQLEKEIPPINESIGEAKADGKTIINYVGDISEATVRMLDKVGYEVNGWAGNEKAQISWSRTYGELCENAGEVEKIAKELNLEIVEVQQPLKQEK